MQSGAPKRRLATAVLHTTRAHVDGKQRRDDRCNQLGRIVCISTKRFGSDFTVDGFVRSDVVCANRIGHWCICAVGNAMRFEIGDVWKYGGFCFV